MHMKTYTTLYLIIILLFAAVGQISGQNIGNLHGINYQAVAIDEDGKEIVGMDMEGKPLYEKEIGVRFTIQKGKDGEVLYQETHSTFTSQHGLFSLTIGKGNQTGGNYSHLNDIPWIDADQWLKVEISIENDGNYRLVSNQRFMSVPYSFYTDNIADNAITTAKILDSAIINEDVASGAIDSRTILNETIQAEDIATGAVETSEILNSTIINEDVASGAIDSRTILNETIQAEDIATDAVETSEILNSTIINEDIANSTINLKEKVKDTLPVENGGTGRGVVSEGAILIGQDMNSLDTLMVSDSAMILTNIEGEGKTKLYKLRAGARTSLDVDSSTNTVTITAAEQGTGPGTGVGTINFGVIDPGSQKVREFPIDGVEMDDIILASVEVDLQGITMSAYVSQPGHVKVVMFNGGNNSENLGTIEVAIANFGKP